MPLFFSKIYVKYLDNFCNLFHISAVSLTTGFLLVWVKSDTIKDLYTGKLYST